MYLFNLFTYYLLHTYCFCYFLAYFKHFLKFCDNLFVIIFNAFKKAKNYYFKDWKYPKLALGKYTIAGIITFQNGKTESFKKSFKIANFPWQNTNVGTNRIIPLPFKELKYKDNEVHVFDICEECYDAWIKQFKLPVKIEKKQEVLC